MEYIVHADIKPHNVLIDQDERTSSVFCVLTDFGISQVFSEKSLLVKAFRPVITNGASITYAAPEALLKLRRNEMVAVDQLPKFYVYSYGVVLYELICRKNDYE